MISVARSDWDHIRIMIRSDQKSVLVRTCFPPRTNQSPISLPHHGYPNRVRIYSQEITVPTEYRSLLLFPYDSCCPSGLEMDSSDCSWQSQAIAVAQFSTTTLLANRRGEEIRCSDWHMDEELCRRDTWKKCLWASAQEMSSHLDFFLHGAWHAFKFVQFTVTAADRHSTSLHRGTASMTLSNKHVGFPHVISEDFLRFKPLQFQTWSVRVVN